MSAQQQWQPEQITFDVDGERVIVNEWPRQIEVVREMFATATPDRLKQDGSTITITVTNGYAIYAVVEHDILRDCLLAVLESSRLSAP